MLTYVAGAKMAREVLVVVFLVGKSLREKVPAIANSRHRGKMKDQTNIVPAIANSRHLVYLQ